MEDGTGDDLVYGGEGNDTLWNTAGSDQMFGDGGNDRFTVQRSGTLAENLTINMGAGNDFAELRIHAPSTYLVDLGDGDDRAELTGDRGTIRMTLGGGRDTVHFATYFSQQTVPTITITDFQVGVGGDRIELAAYLSFRATGWDPSTNPFETGHARLFKSAATCFFRSTWTAAITAIAPSRPSRVWVRRASLPTISNGSRGS
jgi:Ca2+-binding RTX toxin-like protein